MYYIADLHVHSHYAYATSKFLTLESLYQWSKIKGIDVVGTGDCLHPQWLATLQDKLRPLDNGFFELKHLPTKEAIPQLPINSRSVYFCLSTEVSCIYKHLGKVRKGHYLIYFPDFTSANALCRRLSQVSNLAADGRPIIGISAHDLLEIVLTISPRCHLIPAHIWTPWFALFGARSGYDLIEDCFQDLTSHIFALETGLSSDPTMNWLISALDRYTLVSNSDAHSPQNLGREATCFDTALSYDALFEAIKTKKGFGGTLEFFPEAGKYHLDGHRDCHISLLPSQTNKYQGYCPSCKKRVTIGVLHRIKQLADRIQPQQPAGAPNFSYVVPLKEIIADIVGTSTKTKRVNSIYQQALCLFENEFTILLTTPIEDIENHLGTPYAEAIRALRAKRVKKIAGYDGRYGIIQFPTNSNFHQQITIPGI